MAKSIAIKVDEVLLRDIHVRAAEKGVSTQQYITELIKRDLFPEQFPQVTQAQMEQLRNELAIIAQELENVTNILCDDPDQGMDGMSMEL